MQLVPEHTYLVTLRIYFAIQVFHVLQDLGERSVLPIGGLVQTDKMCPAGLCSVLLWWGNLSIDAGLVGFPTEPARRTSLIAFRLTIPALITGLCLVDEKVYLERAWEDEIYTC